MTSSQSQATDTRRRAALDGLRGIAALSVLAFHLGRWLGAPWIAANSGLSVDLFFCLSGYVLPLAYSKKVESLSLTAFVATRLVRLMPMIVLAVAISATYVAFKAHVSGVAVPVSALLSATTLGLLNLPDFNAPAAIGGPQLFPLNGPQYSLFLEIVANIVWWSGRRLPHVGTAAMVAAVCGMLVFWTGLSGDTADSFLSGFPRVGASFAIGVTLFHVDRRLPDHRGWTAVFWCLVVLMVGLFSWPAQMPLVVQLGWILIGAPLLVLAGAHAELGQTVRQGFLFVSALSYPVYALHYPVFCWINGIYRAAFGPQALLVEAPLVAIAVIGVSLVAMRFYDAPVRAYLSQRRFTGSAPVKLGLLLDSAARPGDAAVVEPIQTMGDVWGLPRSS